MYSLNDFLLLSLAIDESDIAKSHEGDKNKIDKSMMDGSPY